MEQYIPKSVLVAEIEKIMNEQQEICKTDVAHGKKYPDSKNVEVIYQFQQLIKFLNTLEVKDPYEQCVQYDSIKAGIQAHAETYSFNIESELFQQLTKEQQKLWRKEIEQAVISGGEMGVELARDMRYKENLEVKEVDLEKEIDDYMAKEWEGVEEDKPLYDMMKNELSDIAKHFFELGLKAQKGEEV